MAKITFVSSDGEHTQIETENGTTLMLAATKRGVKGIIAECGGGCSCATCHVYISEAWLEKVGKPDPMEEVILDQAPNRDSNSRLSCQIDVTEELDGLVVMVPESQY